MSRLIARCPAKVNLGLRVLGRRADGYHEIVTLFQAIDLCDTLEADDAPGLSLAVDDPSVPTDDGNLVLRAAHMLQRRAPSTAALGAVLRLTKRIPAGGGLGGGSSDAAAALLVLSRLWGVTHSAEDLCAMAAELGSDVPFFIRGGLALGSGRGERLKSLRPIPERPLVLGFPPFALSTGEVYRAFPAPLTPPDAGVTVSRLFVNFAERNDFALVTNDLEAPAFAMRGELGAFRDALVEFGAEPALMSGSGSTVFGLFRPGADVASVASRLGDTFPGWTLRVSRTIAAGVRVEPSKDEGGERDFGSAST
jgi:4-diphosphocytidyl-2-C-methyl-D-erythritol kinase